MKKIIIIICFLNTYLSHAQDRPNILWLVCEDMSPYLSCYGNKLLKTPNLDKLAAEGIRFTQAHSNGTQCSPSRSTLISGVYAVSLGTDIHREKRPVPKSFFYPIYLRQAGYFCTNNSKEDYNANTPDNVWNESSNKAHYTNRKNKSQPFFAVFNSTITHMTRVVSPIKNRFPRTVDTNAVSVPEYIPDLPNVRNDIAWNMDAVMLMDKWVGEKLDELQKSGETDNTIIFFYSDHGGTVPRGKAYVYESGTLIPLIVKFPERWRQLAQMSQPAVSNRLVSFIDFPVTVLNLAGVKAPDFMVGKPFFGPGSDKPENENKYIFTFRSNQSASFAPARAITNGQYKLIWNYQSAYPNGTRQSYQWQMPAQQAWDQANQQNNLNPLQKKFWKPVEVFELYNIEKDSLETQNLASDKSHIKIFTELKEALQHEVRKQKDLGFIPKEYRLTLQKQGTLYDVARKNKINVEKEIQAAEIASTRDLANLKILTGYLSDKDPVVQYWGASGICGLAKAGLINLLPPEATLRMNQAEVIPEVKCMLAEAMVYTRKEEQGLAYLLKGTLDGFGPAAAALQNVGNKAKPVAEDLQKALNGQGVPKNSFYMRSVLINCGILPYAQLYKPGEKVAD